MAEKQKTAQGLVSVILPVHNGEQTLREAIDCVLCQDYRPTEIIIADDGSSDGSAEVAASYGSRVRYFHQERGGPASARNLGLRNARGEFIAFIDADDLWPDGKLRMQMRLFSAFPDTEIVQGLINRIWMPPLRPPPSAGAEVDYPFIYTNLGSMIMRRSVFDQVGLFDESLLFHEDTEFWVRAREERVRILVQRRVALIYRIHGRNFTTGHDPKSTGFLKLLLRSINRRRSPSGTVTDMPRLTFMSDRRTNQSATSGLPGAEDLAWPLVSIILYGGRASPHLDRAVASIIEQGYKPAELLILGLNLARSIAADGHFARVVEVDDPADLALGLNAAVEEARGEIVTFLDAAGTWTAGKLHLQVAHLREYPEEGYVVGRTRQFVRPDEVYPASMLDAVAVRQGVGDLLSTLAVRRSTLRAVGAFTPGLAGLQETDWLLRVSDMGYRRRVLPMTMFLRFIEPISPVADGERMTAALLESVRSSVRRKRNSSASATPDHG